MLQCKVCGCKEHRRYIYGTEINKIKIVNHHIIPRRFGGKDVIENTIHLCSECHGQIHALYSQKALENLPDEFFFKTLANYNSIQRPGNLGVRGEAMQKLIDDIFRPKVKVENND